MCQHYYLGLFALAFKAALGTGCGVGANGNRTCFRTDQTAFIQSGISVHAATQGGQVSQSRIQSQLKGDTCGKSKRSCKDVWCCQDSGYTCYEKDSSMAKCLPTGSCLGKRWTCRELTTTTTTTASQIAANVDHLTADTYHEKLRRGLVVSWAEFGADIRLYEKNGAGLPKLLMSATGDAADPAENNYDYIRVRFSGDDTFEQTFSFLDPVINDAINVGLMVLIAHKGWTDEVTWTRAGFIDSWRTVAEHYKTHSDKLAFNLVVETSNVMCHHAATCDLLTMMRDGTEANNLLIEIVRAIRESNPTRVIVFPGPGRLNRPIFLNELDWGSLNAEGLCKIDGNQYCFTEWHVAAAGPCNPETVGEINVNYQCSTSEWAISWTGSTNGTVAQQAHVENIVKYATDFTTKTGIKTWVGAFMPGPYNHAERGHYTYDEQAEFVNYYGRLLHEYGIPFACLSGSRSLFGGPPCHKSVEAKDAFSGRNAPMPDGTLPPECESAVSPEIALLLGLLLILNGVHLYVFIA